MSSNTSRIMMKLKLFRGHVIKLNWMLRISSMVLSGKLACTGSYMSMRSKSKPCKYAILGKSRWLDFAKNTFTYRSQSLFIIYSLSTDKNTLYHHRSIVSYYYCNHTSIEEQHRSEQCLIDPVQPFDAIAVLHYICSCFNCSYLTQYFER